MLLLLVMIGGAVGSALRYGSGRAAVALFGPGYPWGTLFVNVAGGFLMGLLAGTLARFPGPGNETWRVLLGVGLMGGFTTFSSFTLETVTMAQRGQLLLALGYVAVSAAGAVAMLLAGLAATRIGAAA